MAGPKTKPTERHVEPFLDAVPGDARWADSEALCHLLGKPTGEPPVIWGDSTAGFGSQHDRHASGREGNWPRPGFSPRKPAQTFSIARCFDARRDLLARRRKHKIG